MASNLQIVATPTADTGPCLLLHFENRRYIFGHVSEGTTRAMAQQKVATRSLEDIFVAGELNWESMGGLLGLVLTMADSSALTYGALEEVNEARRKRGKDEVTNSISQITIHGAQELNRTLATTRNFIFRQSLSLNARSIKIDQDPRYEDPASIAPDWEDANIGVWYVPLVARVVAQGDEAFHSTFPDHLAEARANPPSLVSKSSWPKEDGKPENGLEQVFVNDEAATAERVAEGVVQDMFGPGFGIELLRGQMLHDTPAGAEVFVRDDHGVIKQYDPQRLEDRKSVEDIPVMRRQTISARHIPLLPVLDGAPRHWKQSICYIVKSHPRRGKFDPAKAKTLGLRPRDFRTLAADQSVTTENGSVVTPEMVMDAPKKGHGFAVIVLPSEDYLDSFLRRPEWSNPSIMEGIEAMYWLRSEKFHHHPQIIEFKERFPSIRHVLLDQEACSNHIAIEAPCAQLVQLNRIDPSRFPIPLFNNKPRSAIQDLRTEKAALHVGIPGASLQLTPVVKFVDDKAVPLLHTGELLQEIERNPELLSLTHSAQEKLAEPAWLEQVESKDKDLPDPDTEITTLGTGSAAPGKYRNVSGTLVRVPGQGSWLLDCGENTLGQMRRFYGQAGLETILKDLRGIYISHPHADHHLGMVSVITAWNSVNHPEFWKGKYNDKRLAVVAPSQIQRFLSEYKELNNFGYHMLDLLQTSTWPKRSVSDDESTEAPESYRPSPFLAQCPSIENMDFMQGLADIRVCFVTHCVQATAVVFTWPSGLKIAYSGDCRPSPQFARMATGAHLLIHECTFEDDKVADARMKQHSTMSEALSVGRLMDAQRVLLTHFSQRYPKVPKPATAQAQRTSLDRPVLFGFDGMRVRLGDFRQAELFMPAIRHWFDTKEEERRLEQEISSRKAKMEFEAKKEEKRALLYKKAKAKRTDKKGAARKDRPKVVVTKDVDHPSDSSAIEGKSPRKKVRKESPGFSVDQAAVQPTSSQLGDPGAQAEPAKGNGAW